MKPNYSKYLYKETIFEMNLNYNYNYEHTKFHC